MDSEGETVDGVAEKKFPSLISLEIKHLVPCIDGI
jgi:hypothetical protein